MPPPFSISYKADSVRSYPVIFFLDTYSGTAPFSIMSAIKARILLLRSSYLNVIVVIVLNFLQK